MLSALSWSRFPMLFWNPKLYYIIIVIIISSTAYL
jgi:hypothetical protein